MDDRRRANLALWNELAEINYRSELYDVKSFLAGENHLNPLERGELGDVRGRTMLHLQCHFGLDSLSWVQLGAQVTGVDFSDRAIEQARALSAECGLPARFLCCDIYDLPRHLEETFDIVYTSYGVLCWLSDLKGWAQLAVRYLKPGGTFYMAEFHPFTWVFDDDQQATELRLRYPYFNDEPFAFEVTGSYADRSAETQQKTSYEWTHSMGDILSALLEVGLQLEFVHEFPYTVYQMFPFMQKHADGYWWLPDQAKTLPLQFSLRATKPIR